MSQAEDSRADDATAAAGGGPLRSGLETPLSGAQRQTLRGLAHAMHPIVELGRQGLTEAFVGELERSLESHELIKIRLRADRAERRQLAAELTSRLRCEVVGLIGQVAILYRPAPEPERRRLLSGGR
jgi:RNA-binding protein